MTTTWFITGTSSGFGRALGTIDVIVNNAGYGVFAAVEDASDEQV
jgi:NAD(P)-dependent dehydrogenase (short-subunit alcohol dehydrogenase family)